MKNERGQGRTSEQMKNAPLDAVFVWGNSHLLYPKDLAKRLGRADLQIVRPADLERLMGRPLTGLVIDHAARLSPKESDVCSLLDHYCQKRA